MKDSPRLLELLADNPEERLIVYGSLAPGGVNNFMLADLGGYWLRCRIKGVMERCRGFKAFRFDPEGEEHSAWLLVSPGLPARYADLDDFEGEGYRRAVIPAQVEGQEVLANIYEGVCD